MLRESIYPKQYIADLRIYYHNGLFTRYQVPMLCDNVIDGFL